MGVNGAVREGPAKPEGSRELQDEALSYDGYRRIKSLFRVVFFLSFFLFFFQDECKMIKVVERKENFW